MQDNDTKLPKIAWFEDKTLMENCSSFHLELNGVQNTLTL